MIVVMDIDKTNSSKKTRTKSYSPKTKIEEKPTLSEEEDKDETIKTLRLQIEALQKSVLPIDKETLDRISQWTCDRKYKLSSQEKQFIQIFLYHPEINIFQYIKDQGISLTSSQIKQIILSSITKKVYGDAGII